MGDRVHLIVDGLDVQDHYVEVSAVVADAANPLIEAIAELEAGNKAGRAADRNIAHLGHANAGIYRPADYLAIACRFRHL